MGIIKLRKFHPEDIVRITYRENEAKMLSQVDREKIDYMVQQGPAYTAVLEGKVLVCAGVSILWKGVGEAWLLTHPDIGDYRIWFYRKLKKMFNLIIKKYKLHRVQSDVDCNFQESCNMMEHLGFEIESLMQSYGPNKEDFVRYVLVAEGGVL